MKIGQESSITDLFQAVAKERGVGRTVLEHAPQERLSWGACPRSSPDGPTEDWYFRELEVRRNQESSIIDLFQAVAKERGDGRTVSEHAPCIEFQSERTGGKGRPVRRRDVKDSLRQPRTKPNYGDVETGGKQNYDFSYSRRDSLFSLFASSATATQHRHLYPPVIVIASSC